MEESIWSVKKRYNVIWVDLSCRRYLEFTEGRERFKGYLGSGSGRRHLEGTEWERWVQGYLGRPVWKHAFGGTGKRYDEIIQTYFQEIELSGEIDWTGLVEWPTDVLL